MVTEVENRISGVRMHCEPPTDRKAQPEEVGNVIAFLLSEDAKFVNGSIYSVDNGWTI
jgi:NAD(P)-dependent dehydrogenase (short-subunit alcohol dehydrogenase family)